MTLSRTLVIPALALGTLGGWSAWPASAMASPAQELAVSNLEQDGLHLPWWQGQAPTVLAAVSTEPVGGPRFFEDPSEDPPEDPADEPSEDPEEDPDDEDDDESQEDDGDESDDDESEDTDEGDGDDDSDDEEEDDEEDEEDEEEEEEEEEEEDDSDSDDEVLPLTIETLTSVDWRKGDELPDEVMKYDGKRVKISGYMATGTEMDATEFELVPQNCECGKSKVNHFVQVIIEDGGAEFDPGRVQFVGRLEIGEVEEDGFVTSLYRLTIETFDPQEPDEDTALGGPFALR